MACQPGRHILAGGIPRQERGRLQNLSRHLRFSTNGDGYLPALWCDRAICGSSKSQCTLALCSPFQASRFLDHSMTKVVRSTANPPALALA